MDVVRLRYEPEARALTVLVRFPAGWTRIPSGYYEAAEDVAVLEGALEMTGVTYASGTWAYLPAGSIRRASCARTTTLALARFSGPARWIRSEVSVPGARPSCHRLEPGATSTASPLGSGRAWLLRAGFPESSWLTEPPDAGRPSPVSVELLDPARRRWAWVPAGAPLPHAGGLCFCRTFS